MLSSARERHAPNEDQRQHAEAGEQRHRRPPSPFPRQASSPHGLEVDAPVESILKSGYVREAVVLSKSEAVEQCRFHWNWDIRVQLAGRLQVILFEHPVDTVGRLLSGHQVVKGGGQRVLITAGIRAGATELFGWGEAGSHSPGAGGGLILSERLGDPEVDQHHPAIGLQFEIARLEIAVDDGWLASVKKGQRFANVVCPADRFSRVRRLAYQAGLQVLALDIVHHQILDIGQDEVIGDPR